MTSQEAELRIAALKAASMYRGAAPAEVLRAADQYLEWLKLSRIR